MLVGAAGSFGPLDLEFWLLAGLVLLGELYPIQVHGQTGEETFSTPFGFAMLLIYGAPQVALVQAVSSLIADLIRRRPADRIVFNLAQLTISWAAAGAVLDLLGGTGLSSGDSLQADELPAITASAVAFFLVNSTLVRTAEALQLGIAVGAHLIADLLFRSWSAGTLFVLGPPVAVIAENWLYLVPVLALPMAAIHVASQQASEMERLALYDPLTALPNRALLNEHVAQAVRRASASDLGVALVTLDLDRFRDVNDTLGRPQGDALLVEVAGRLQGSTRAGDTVARLGADEFGVLLSAVADRAEAEATTRVAAEAAFDAGGGGGGESERGRELRDSDVPRARVGRRAAGAARGDGDVPGEARAVAAGVLRARDGPGGAAAAGAGVEPEASDRLARDRAALPAEDRAGRPAGGGGGGAGPLDRSRARDRCRPVCSCR